MRKFLYVIVFISGMVSLAVEFAASRLLGNYFGTSNLVWASIVGLILIYLTAGYFIGGAWADRSPKHETLFMILSWAALAVGLIPLASRPILRLASNAFDELQLGALFGSFVVVMVLFVIPVTLIGMASPFAIRLAITDTQQVGKISGRIYAISTLGSFTGTFVPTLLLIPTIGTYRTFLVLASLLMLFAFIGLFISSGWRKLLRYVWMPLVIVALFIWGVPGTDKNTTGLVYETESSYNYIQVIEKDEFTMLRLNEGQGVHSIYKADQLFFNGPWEQVVAAPFFNSAPVAPDQITDIAIIGLAAGTTVRDAALVFPNAVIDGIEIDPKIVEVGRKYFDMNDPNLNVIIQDGRWAIKNSTKKYDIISVDAYRPPYIPWHMTTQEFFLILKDHLKEDGVMVINIGRSTDDRRLIDSLYSTIHTVFPTLYVTDLSDSFNSILFATNTETNLQNFLDNYVILNEDPLTNQFILGVMATTYAGLQDTPNIGMVFTDDLAPIEGITNSLIMQFIFSGEVETLE
ncbi:MAG: spermine synthase [Chloroflexi bacterium HGW-Chloroflexi-5]|nr:MAG: spermine synthase [Chloroflexi bacterium HGW-Chloroflexi-5]